MWVENTKNCGITKCIKVDIVFNKLYYDEMNKILLCSLLLVSSHLMAEEYRIEIKPSEYIIYSNEKITVDPDCVRDNFKDFPTKIKNKDGITIKEFIVDNQSTKIKRIITDKNSIYYINNGVAYIKNQDLKNKEILISHGVYKGDRLNQKWNLWVYSFDSKNIKECIKKVEVQKEEAVKPEKLKKPEVALEKNTTIVPIKTPEEPIKKEDAEKTISKQVKEIPILPNKESRVENNTKKQTLSAPAITNDAAKIFGNNKPLIEDKKSIPENNANARKEPVEIVKIIGAESIKKEPTVVVKEKEKEKEKIKPQEEKKTKHAVNVANKIKLPQNVRYCVLEETEKLVYQRFPNYEMTEFEKDPKFQEHMDESIIKALEICSKKK